jgi:hypothetical protein
VIGLPEVVVQNRERRVVYVAGATGKLRASVMTEIVEVTHEVVQSSELGLALVALVGKPGRSVWVGVAVRVCLR